MSSRHLIRPELMPYLEAFPFQSMTAEMAAMMRANPMPLPPPPEIPNLAVSERRAPGQAGAPDVRVLVFQPTDRTEPMPAILHIHGGGYVIGAPEMNEASNRELAADLGCVIVSVDYRLAPDTPFPGPVEDCYAALKWLHANAAELGVDPGRIAIQGESAGGGLAAGLALLARDRGEVPLIFQFLLYPMLDDRPAGEPHPYTGEFVWNQDSNRFGWSAYLGHEPGGPDVSPYAAAARAENLAGLPPTAIVTGALDLFLEENMEYARRLTRAGVPVDLQVYSGAFHGFQVAPDTELSRRFRRDHREAMTAALAPR
jgi:acetyl esterase/lipase